MSISKYPSKLSLPQTNPGVSTVLEYLILKFQDIDPIVWKTRMAQGKVHWHDGTPIAIDSAFRPQQRVYYYREVENELTIPFDETIIFQDDHILVAHKPHFLAVTPGGKYINECLQNRLRAKTGISSLQALHRLDRVTAGLVMFSLNKETRPLYHNLFSTQHIRKTYQAIATINPDCEQVDHEWIVKNRIERSQARFRMLIVDGEANSHSIIRCLQQHKNRGLFDLKPVTGKTHQLRLHMQSLGWPILNDRYYPTLQALSEDDYTQPLQLLAKKLEFVDPVSRQLRTFRSDVDLNINAQ